MTQPIIDRRTQNYDLPSPGPNLLEVDVLRLIDAMQIIDTVLKANADAIALRALASAIKSMPLGDLVGTTDAQRLTGKVLDTKVATLASASTVDIGMAHANRIIVTGVTTINSFGAASAGVSRTVTFAGALTLIHSANLLLPGAANIATEAGDAAEFESVTPGTWRCTSYHRASGTALVTSSKSDTIAVISTNTTAVRFTTYVLTASLILNLPANPSTGDWVPVVNRSGTITAVIGRNGQKIMGLAEDMTLNQLNASVRLVFADATRGWVIS